MADHVMQQREERTVEIIQSEQQQEKKKYFENGDSLRDLWDNSKLANICTWGVPEGEERF